MSHMRRVLLAMFTLMLIVVPKAYCDDPPTDISVKELGTKFRLVGKLGKPLGTMVAIQGLIVEGPLTTLDDGTCIVVQRIDGKLTQNGPVIKLEEPRASRLVDDLKTGRSCELHGFETGEFVGEPIDAYREINIPRATVRFLFYTDFLVSKTKNIAAVGFTPADFVDRDALIQGQARTAEGRAYVVGTGWRIRVSDESWPAWMEGKA